MEYLGGANVITSSDDGRSGLRDARKEPNVKEHPA